MGGAPVPWPCSSEPSQRPCSTRLDYPCTRRNKGVQLSTYAGDPAEWVGWIRRVAGMFGPDGETTRSGTDRGGDGSRPDRRGAQDATGPAEAALTGGTSGSGDGEGPPPMSPEDRAEFEAFFTENQDRVYRNTLTVACGDKDAALDATYEAFARAYKHWEKVLVHPRPLGWVIKTAMRVCIDEWRKRELDVPLEGSDRPAPEPTSHLEIFELLGRYLDPRERQVVAMAVNDGMRTREIADDLGYSPGVVRMLKNRGFDKLRKGIVRDRAEQ
jgi:RNA polymerase sigma factor (sigma-70 family)